LWAIATQRSITLFKRTSAAATKATSQRAKTMTNDEESREIAE
jgi:hypothetical protein